MKGLTPPLPARGGGTEAAAESCHGGHPDGSPGPHEVMPDRAQGHKSLGMTVGVARGVVSTSCHQLEIDEVTVETCMGKAFDVVIRYQLDPVWNQLVWH